MDWPHWVGFTASALSGAVVALGGAWFWIRRNQLRLWREETELQEQHDASVSKHWRELMEYKSDDFRKKNQEQDARTAAMIAKMDEMHANHLKCERDAVEREIVYNREVAQREILTTRLEARILDLTSQMATLRFDLESMRVSHLAIAESTAAKKLLQTATDVAAVLEKCNADSSG